MATFLSDQDVIAILRRAAEATGQEREHMEWVAKHAVTWKQFAAAYGFRANAFDDLTWGERLETMLEGYLRDPRATQAYLAPTLRSTFDWFEEERYDGMIEGGRAEVMDKIREIWRRDPRAIGGRGFLPHLYAMLTIVIGEKTYASVAEKETATFIASLSGERLISLRPSKRGNQTGFDGVFYGEIPALEITRDTFAGCEVKTVTDAFAAAVNRMTDKTRESYEVNAIDRARRDLEEIATRARDRVVRQRAEELIALIPHIGGRHPTTGKRVEIATVLVVRSCTLGDRLRVPDRAYELFDRIVATNVFGEPIPNACVRVDREARAVYPIDLARVERGIAAFQAQRAMSLLIELSSQGIEVPSEPFDALRP